MAQCESKVFFPDDPTQRPQFTDCPRDAATSRRILHSVMRLCSICARAWDEQVGQAWTPTVSVLIPSDVCSKEPGDLPLRLPVQRDDQEPCNPGELHP